MRICPLIFVFTILSFFCAEQALSYENKLPKVVLVTTSEGCHCTLSKCREAENLLNSSLVVYKGKIDFEEINYSLKPAEVKQLSRKYKFFTLPAMLFFDKIGQFKGKLDYGINKNSINTKLKEVVK